MIEVLQSNAWNLSIAWNKVLSVHTNFKPKHVHQIPFTMNSVTVAEIQRPTITEK